MFTIFTQLGKTFRETFQIRNMQGLYMIFVKLAREMRKGYARLHYFRPNLFSDLTGIHAVSPYS